MEGFRRDSHNCLKFLKILRKIIIYPNVLMNHLVYMDDVRLYSHSKREIESLIFTLSCYILQGYLYGHRNIKVYVMLFQFRQVSLWIIEIFHYHLEK